MQNTLYWPCSAWPTSVFCLNQCTGLSCSGKMPCEGRDLAVEVQVRRLPVYHPMWTQTTEQQATTSAFKLSLFHQSFWHDYTTAPEPPCLPSQRLSPCVCTAGLCPSWDHSVLPLDGTPSPACVRAVSLGLPPSSTACSSGSKAQRCTVTVLVQPSSPSTTSQPDSLALIFT